MKRFIGILLALCLLLSAVPVSATAAEAAQPRYLYVGGVAVAREYTVGAVTSGQGWRYDVATAILYLTDGADIRYSSTTEDSLENGIYCSGGTLNIHASGTVNITGYGNGIDLPDGSLSLYAMHDASTVRGNSHILIRKIVSTDDSACGLTVGYDPYQLTGEAGYYTRSEAAAEFTADGDITEIDIGYFELYYPGHLTRYYSNGGGTHALSCPPVCNSGFKGESIPCSGTAAALDDGGGAWVGCPGAKS